MLKTDIINKAFIREWHDRYVALVAEGKVIAGQLRGSDEGCFCAVGVAYDMLIEQGMGNWHYSVGGHYNYVFPEHGVYTESGWGIERLIGIAHPEVKDALIRSSVLHQIVIENDRSKTDEAAKYILEVEQYVPA